MAQSEESAETGTAVSTPPAASLKPEAKPTSGGGGFTLFLAVIALLVALASAGWQGYQFWLEKVAPEDDAWVADLKGLESRLDIQQREQQLAQTKLQGELDEGQQSLRERIQTLQAESEAALTQQLQSITWVKQRQQALDERLQALVKLSREDWILAEADYLLRLAQQRLQLGGSGVDAETLMVAAQRNLQLVHDKGIERVRDVVGADLAAVKEASQFDLVGLDRRIADLATRSQALTPLGDRKLKAEPVVEQAPPPELALETLWPLVKYAFASAADKLQSYIRISDRDSAYQNTVIAGGQRELFQQNLQLLFEQARWALLRGNADLYRQALQRSEQWLRQYYALEESELALIEELSALQAQPIRAATPPISNSITALQYFIDSRHGAVEARP